jgi:hypothetical protein
MKYPNNIVREFGFFEKNGIGSINAKFLPNNTIYVKVNLLHDNISPDNWCDYNGEADVVVKYPENVDLYQTVITIFDKLTEDHQFYLRNKKYIDRIVCRQKFVQANPQLPYIKLYEWGWMLEFIPENMKYVNTAEELFEATKNNITIYGEVFDDGTFIYDYPVISRYMDKKYYDITRGKMVWCIKLNMETSEYEYDPKFEEKYLKYLNNPYANQDTNYFHTCSICSEMFDSQTRWVRHSEECKNMKTLSPSSPENNKIMPVEQNQYIYLIQEREFIKTGEPIYKIGKTKQENLTRFNQYPKGSRMLCQLISKDCDEDERVLLGKFRTSYVPRKDIGSEYFEGDYEKMIQDIYETIFQKFYF